MPDGKICYIEIPATDIDESARFYETVFNWKSRVRGDGHRAFDDTTGAVSGSWVLGRPPLSEMSMLTYIMVDDLARTLRKVTEAGGKLGAPAKSIGSGREAFATFYDPAGNLFGLYQER